ncbi:MAG: nucleotidyltransferase domain-containing protein [Athalassotoga sp.]
MNRHDMIKDISKKYNIGLVYLFGSQKDNAKRIIDGEKVTITDSLADIDVGIVFNFDLLNLKDRYKLYADIYNEFEDIFLPYRLDLVFLQEHHSVFQCQAIIGYCVYSESEKFKDFYEEQILKHAADFKYVLDRYYEERLEDI